MSERTFSPEQRAVIDTWNRGQSVLAGAGSGKTTTIVEKCHELMRRNPEARFAAVSFTEKSASDLRTRLAPLTRGQQSQHWITTIHGLCATIMREFPQATEYEGDETQLSETEMQLLWERAVDSLWADELPDDLALALEIILDREGRDGTHELLKRVKELYSFGIAEAFGKSTQKEIHALGKIFHHVFERYFRLKKRRGVLDFDDLERGADQALRDAKIRAVYQKRFDLVLVDEFQDTNPTQARIIRNFTKLDASNLCVVGDPKQSIYRFRDAEVSVFEDFCNSMPEKQSLTLNFRSRPGILNFTNAVCEKAFKFSKMTYDPLTPTREDSGDAVLRVNVKSPQDLAAWIANENSKGIPLDQMVLLMRRIRGNQKWIKGLTSAGIPLAIGSGGLFWDEPRVREMMALLKWWDNPQNQMSAAVFFRAPWVGVSDEQIDQWIKNDKTFRTPFFESSLPIAQALKPFQGKVIRPAELLMALLIDQKVEDELGSTLLGLWHRAEELSMRGLDYHATIMELSRAMQESRREREIPPPKNLGLLSVMTLHSSKGLEFPHVLLVDFEDRPKRIESPLLYWDRNKGVYLSPRDEQGNRDKKDAVSEEWKEEEKKKEIAESKRVLYVAFTRAQERLVLVCLESESKKNEASDEKEVFSKDYWRNWLEWINPELKTEIVQTVEQKKYEQFTAKQELRQEKSLAKQVTRFYLPRHSVTEWVGLGRCERFYEWKYISQVRSNQKDKSVWLESDETDLTQMEIGTRVHACLERADYDALRELEKEAGPSRLSAEPIISWAKTSIWMKPEKLSNDLTKNFKRQVWTELSFEIPISGETLVGSIDRLVREQDEFRIIDFKVTAQDRAPEKLIASYKDQLALYAAAVERLEPRAKVGKNLTAMLVAMSPKQVQEIEVPLEQIPIDTWAKNASEIVRGRSGTPRPSPHCGTCDFRKLCPEGLQWQS